MFSKCARPALHTHVAGVLKRKPVIIGTESSGCLSEVGLLELATSNSFLKILLSLIVKICIKFFVSKWATFLLLGF